MHLCLPLQNPLKGSQSIAIGAAVDGFNDEANPLLLTEIEILHGSEDTVGEYGFSDAHHGWTF